jgi:hypothetical protein
MGVFFYMSRLLSVKAEHMLRMFQNRMPRKIFGSIGENYIMRSFIVVFAIYQTGLLLNRFRGKALELNLGDARFESRLRVFMFFLSPSRQMPE